MEQKGGTNGHINISETVLVLQRSHESNSKGATAENFGENGLHFFFCMSNPGTVRFTSSKNLFLFGSHRIRGFEGMKHGHPSISHLYLESFYWP